MGTFDELEAVGEERPIWMRHSQGDQWDLLIVYPIGTMAGYFGERRANARARLAERETAMNQITGCSQRSAGALPRQTQSVRSPP